MNLTILKEQIQAGLQAVQNIVSTRTTLPILSNVLIRADGQRVEFTATDLDVTISCSVEGQVRSSGATTLPVKKIVDIVRELAVPEIEIEVDEKNVCTVQAGSSYFKIRGLAAEEFPPLPSFGDDKKVVLPQAKVKSMLRKTAFATSTDESRYVLNGIFFSLKAQKMVMVATDGRRLALVEEAVDVPENSQADFIVPSKAVTELTRLLQDKGDVEIRFTENQALFTLKDEKGGAMVIITKLIEGNYPNYQQVIPRETKERVVLGREDFLHALRRAKIMTSDKQNSVKLAFGKNILAITANTPEVGEARESMAINYKGKEMAIAFNPDYVIEPLGALDEENIALDLIDELSPGVIRGDKGDEPFLCVVMPMRLT
jgi:DNA polymerase III subunit beta